MKHISEYQTTQNREKLPTGNALLDQLIEHFLPGELVVLAGEGGCRKECLMYSMISNIILHHNIPVCFFCNTASGSAGFYENIITFFRENNPQECAPILKDSPLYVEYNEHMMLDKVESTIREYATKGIKLFMIDSMNLIEFVSDKPYEETYKISLSLKRLAAELQIAIVVTAGFDSNYYCYYHNTIEGPKIHYLGGESKLNELADIIIGIDYPILNGIKQDSKGRDISNKLILAVLKSNRNVLRCGYLNTPNPFTYINPELQPIGLYDPI